MDFTFDYLDQYMNTIFEEKRECEDEAEAKQLAKKLFGNSNENDLYALEVRYYNGNGYTYFIIN